MNHIKYISISMAFVLGIFVAVGQGSYILLKPLVANSQFRLAVANNAAKVVRDKSNVLLLMGNSRIMGGIDTTILNGTGEFSAVYNLAYNGLDFADAQALISAFQQSCKCKLSKVIINAGVLPQQRVSSSSKHETVSDVKVFLAAFNAPLSRDILETDPKLGATLNTFPIIHFNNELFLRSIYYLVTGKSDQSYSNNYSFTLTEGMIQRLKKKELKAAIDMKALTSLITRLNSNGAKLAIIIPPFHPAYVENVQNFDVYTDDLGQVADEQGIALYDHSRLFMNEADYFADPVHINTTGQKEYSKYLLDKVFGKSEDRASQASG